MGKALLADGEGAGLTATQRADAGRKAAELIKSQPQVKASEALGQQMEKGYKRTTTTQADRTRVGGGNIGGAPFPAISEADPAYAGKVWGVMDEGTAARLKNLTDDETAWTTMLGSASQLKTNPIVFEKLKRGFVDSMKQGNLSDELAGKINHNLELTFGEGADIRNPKIWRQADTFEKRAALADVMMGKGIAPSKGGIAIGGEKSGKGVIFKPTDILKRETEPSLLHTEHGGDVPTFAAGPRLFRLNKESVYDPTLHPGFPTLLTGEDLKVNMIPTPTEVYLRDWHAKFKKDNPDRKSPGYYDLALGVKGEGLPSQDLNDEYIRHLLREGFKDGGAVDLEASDARLTKAIENRMAKGGGVDLEASDARLADAIAQRMAGGGKVKGVAKAFKRLFADDMVNGMRIREDIPNTSSIGASLSDYSTHGLQEVPMSAFETVGKPRYRSVQEETRTKELARQIQENKELNPLIVVKDAEGHYILEGGHRFDALRELDIDSFPALMVHDLESLGTVAKADGGKIVKGLGRIGKRLMSDEQIAGDAIGKAAQSAGMNAPVTANKPLTDIKDFHTSLMDSVRERSIKMQKEMDSFDYKYSPDQYVFTEHGVKNNLPPLKILERSRAGGNLMWEGEPWTSKKIIDPATGKAQRTPYGPGYKVRREMGEDWSEFVIPESLIKGDVEMAMGGLAHMAPGGLLKGLSKVGKRIMADPADSSMISSGTRKFGDQMGGNTIVKETGGNWLPSTDRLVYRTQLDRELEKLQKGKHNPSSKYIKEMLDEASLRGDEPQVAGFTRDLQSAIGNEATNNWVNSNLSNYVTKQMGTEADPVRKLAEEGITAFPKNVDEYGDLELHTFPNFDVKARREEFGSPVKGVAENPLAQHYEFLADQAILPTQAKHYQRVQALPDMQRPRGFADMPWVNKVDPETNIYNISADADFNKMGFDHIVDVLREDLATGRIRPEQLNKVSMEQAVRRAHQYDEELKQKMLNARVAEQANANVYKEYPEGYKWVQLDKPGQFSLESDVMGHSVRGYEPPEGHIDWSDISGNSGYADYGHGGWEAIKSGQAKVYSLRDSKGMSHATIEVKAPQVYTEDDIGTLFPSGVLNAMKKNGDAGVNEYVAQKLKELNLAPPRITQIKGKQNAAPNEEYLPYVQDFVKSGKFSEVGDFANTGLVRIYPESDLAVSLHSKGLRVPSYASEKELTDLLKQAEVGSYRDSSKNISYINDTHPDYRAEPPEGMAEGGGAFKKLQFMDKGGITTSAGTFSPEELGVSPSELEPDKKLWKAIKRNAPREYEAAKQHMKEEASQLKTLGGVKDFALRTSAQYLGGIPDLVNFGLYGVDALADTNLSSEKPWFGSDQYIDAMKKYGVVGEHEFPVSEVVAGLLAPAGLIKKGIKKIGEMRTTKETPKKRQGGLSAVSR